jgi:hypothetical protein
VACVHHGGSTQIREESFNVRGRSGRRTLARCGVRG